jgi:hypothetical protein
MLEAAFTFLMFAADPSLARAGLAPDSAEPGVAGAAMKTQPPAPPVEEIIVQGERDRAREKQIYHDMRFRELERIYAPRRARPPATVAGFIPGAGGMGAAGAAPIQDRPSATVMAIRSAGRPSAIGRLRDAVTTRGE